ncbi:MAG TPA: DUF763 domain-containing protein, partial [Candidatus Nanoarchaeia archaeon]|nr:DUF763 domain-containing protein [Candidatus Nanoarchaeia archaeon]
MKIGIANLPLHSGHCPKWLFPRMVKLAGAISETVVNEYGEKELLNRLSDPFWFQGFSCILGFDWHSSGTTTTTCGAVKEALKKENTGIFVAGGKGNASKKTPLEIRKISEQLNLPDNKIQKLIYSSKISAKVDNSLVQDSYHLYHHVFVFTEKGDYAVIQQGMNNSNNKNSLLGAIRRLKPAVLRSSLNREFLELKTVGLKSEVLNPPVFNN